MVISGFDLDHRSAISMVRKSENAVIYNIKK